MRWGLSWCASQGRSAFPQKCLFAASPFPPTGWPAGRREELGASRAVPRNATGISNVPFGPLSLSNLLHHLKKARGQPRLMQILDSAKAPEEKLCLCAPQHWGCSAGRMLSSQQQCAWQRLGLSSLIRTRSSVGAKPLWWQQGWMYSSDCLAVLDFPHPGTWIQACAWELVSSVTQQWRVKFSSPWEH